MAKPKLVMMRGRDARDPEALARFYAALKGIEVTPELVEEARVGLDEAFADLDEAEKPKE
jgi:hypothetical protein